MRMEYYHWRIEAKDHSKESKLQYKTDTNALKGAWEYIYDNHIEAGALYIDNQESKNVENYDIARLREILTKARPERR